MSTVSHFGEGIVTGMTEIGDSLLVSFRMTNLRPPIPSTAGEVKAKFDTESFLESMKLKVLDDDTAKEILGKKRVLLFSSENVEGKVILTNFQLGGRSWHLSDMPKIQEAMKEAEEKEVEPEPEFIDCGYCDNGIALPAGEECFNCHRVGYPVEEPATQTVPRKKVEEDTRDLSPEQRFAEEMNSPPESPKTVEGEE